VDGVGRFRPGFDGSENYDLILRLVESTDRIAHIPEPLYSSRSRPGSGTAEAHAKPRIAEAAKLALDDALRRRGRPGKTQDELLPSLFRARYALPGRPRVSIIIPTRDGLTLLKRCIDSVLERSTYDNYEIVVIDNGSRDPGTLAYLANFPGRVIRYDYPFNYARMMNLAAWDVECDAMLFLNNDTEVISPDWIEALLEHGMRPEVGAVGGRLYYPDGRIQHEGILCGVLGTAANVDHCGYWALGDTVRNCSAVTGACTMIRPRVYWEVGGNDERLRVAYNDVDICLRIRQAGYEIVYTPYAQLRHYESATRSGYEHAEDSPWFEERWRQFDEWDKYYNRNFDRWAMFHLAL
jgi:GT2 family glycosyltransferase